MLNKLGGIESDLTVSVVDDDGPQRQLGVKGKVKLTDKKLKRDLHNVWFWW